MVSYTYPEVESFFLHSSPFCRHLSCALRVWSRWQSLLWTLYPHPQWLQSFLHVKESRRQVWGLELSCIRADQPLHTYINDVTPLSPTLPPVIFVNSDGILWKWPYQWVETLPCVCDSRQFSIAMRTLTRSVADDFSGLCGSQHPFYICSAKILSVYMPIASCRGCSSWKSSLLGCPVTSGLWKVKQSYSFAVFLVLHVRVEGTLFHALYTPGGIGSLSIFY